MQKRNQPPISLIALTMTATLGLTAGCQRGTPVADATLPTVNTAAVTTQPTTPPTTAPAPTAPPTTDQPVATPAPTTAAPPPGDNNPGDDDTGNETVGDPGGGVKTLMTWEAVRALIDPEPYADEVEALDWGDVDGDGDDDVLVRSQWCGAACGQQIDLVFNDNGTPVRYDVTPELLGDFEQPWQPWFIPSSAAQTLVVAGAIDGSTITITGESLCGEIDWEVDLNAFEQCAELERTATYRLVDGALQPISITP